MKHHLSFDWLLCGDLKGRLRMARDEMAPLHEPPRPALTTETVLLLVSTLTAEEQQWLAAKMNEVDGGAA
jgi:hypothetical protein